MSDRMTTAQVAEYFGITTSGAKNIANSRGWHWEPGPYGACLWSRADVEAERDARRTRAELQAARPAKKRYASRHDAPAPDSFNREGAEALARRIREYWQRRGKLVDVRVESNRSGFTPAMRGAEWFVVRSDMVKGRPRK